MQGKYFPPALILAFNFGILIGAKPTPFRREVTTERRANTKARVIAHRCHDPTGLNFKPNWLEPNVLEVMWLEQYGLNKNGYG